VEILQFLNYATCLNAHKKIKQTLKNGGKDNVIKDDN